MKRASPLPLLNPEGNSGIRVLQVKIKPEEQKLPDNLWISTKQEARSLRPQKKEEVIFHVSESERIFLASVRSWS